MIDYRFSRIASQVRGSAIRELLRDALRPGMISLAGGLPQAELFDVPGIRRAAEAVFDRQPRTALQYGRTEGQESLQSALAAHLIQRGIRVEAGAIQVTTGSQQALDLIARAFLDEGDCVALEVPTYLAAVQAFDLRSARYLAIPTDADGADIGGLASSSLSNPAALPKIVYVVSNFANPTGASLSLERRRALLRWAAERRVFVLEDDPYGELRFSGVGPPPLWALARDIPGASAWCGYASSLSKIVAPGLRIGWIVLPPPVAEVVTRLKQALDLHTSSFVQEIAAHYLRGGELEPRLAIARTTYSAQCSALSEALLEHLGDELTFNAPAGGMFLWCRFRERIDTAALLPHARDCGMIFVPGAVFYPFDGDTSTLRLSFATQPPEGLREGARRLAKALQLYRAAQSGRPQLPAGGPLTERGTTGPGAGSG